MAGQVRERAAGVFVFVRELGYETVYDKATGTPVPVLDAAGQPVLDAKGNPKFKRKRVQEWITFRATAGLSPKQQRDEAEAHFRKALTDRDSPTFVKLSKMPLIDWLRNWVATSAKASDWRPATVKLYRNVIECHIAKSRIALLPIQKVLKSDIEDYLGTFTVRGRRPSAATIGVHHSVLHHALNAAVDDRLLAVNPAFRARRPKRSKIDRKQALKVHCWTGLEARRFLAFANETASPQVAAYMFLALDSGARRSELDGLAWSHVNLDAGVVTFERQLDRAGASPLFGPTKTGEPRDVKLGPETVDALRRHRQTQLELKMANRRHFDDFGLVFSKEQEDLQRPNARLGQPLTTLGGSKFRRLVKAAGVKRIKAHGMRHTCATLLLAAGEPVHSVSARLGHASAKMTLDVYSHSDLQQQERAALALSHVLHGAERG